MFQNLIVDLNDYTINKKLGEGQYGSVYLVKKKENGKKFAAKVSKVECVKASEEKVFFQELTALSKVNHAAVLSLKGFSMTNFEEDNFPTLIFSYMLKGSLDKLIDNDPKFPLSKKYIILLGIAEGMKYLHSNGIIHRDLKPSNILLDNNYYPYIGDFGESKISDQSKSEIIMNTYKGSPAFMAPEIFLEGDYNYKADIFSYAILTYMLLTHRYPYSGYRTIFRLQSDVSKGKRPDLSYIKDKNFKKFLTKCWSSDPKERPDFDQIVEELKEERYRESMNANYKEVTQYLKLFGDELPKIEKMTEKVLNIKEKADSGDTNAMYEYAIMLRHGDGVAVNKQEAIRYFKMAIEKGNSDAMNNYAIMLEKGNGVSVNKQEAIRYYKMAIEKGSSSAMNNYAIMLRHGDGVSVNKQEASRYYKMAIEKGNINAMNNYAIMLKYGDGIAVNKQEAARYYKMAIEKGNILAITNYAILLYEDDGVSVNKQEAIRYYKMAIEKGSSNAMNNYAVMLKYGNGVAVNKQEAIRYFKMAIEKGNSDAMINYAIMLEQGDEVAVNKQEAIRYYKMAIEKGNEKALNNYVFMLKQGDGIAVDKQEVARYYKMAKENGYTYAEQYLSLILKDK